MSATDMQGIPPGDGADPDLELVLPGKGLGAGAGIEWIGQGWSLFARAPLMWIVSLIIVFIVAIALNFVPLIGGIFFQLMQPVIAGGFVVACRSLENGGEFELEHLMQGFSKRFVPLVIVGLVFMLATLAIIAAFALVAGVAWLGLSAAGDATQAMNAVMEQPFVMLLFLLVFAAVLIPLTAAYWFAPALVMMHDMKPLAAMKESFFACFRNIVPFLLYGIIMGVAGVLAMLPFGLGLLVWVPVLIASTYAAYRQIFTD